ncbi:MAG: InlB B-repeat-containing protein [Kiritimatiellae bacterium]|nr:InlB B-repeat-containing protein [Kiritimatiellia bacterium]
MNKRMMMLVAGLAWVCGVFGATHEGVQLWENGPLWAKTNVGANSPTETGYYFWWGDTLGYKWQNSKWVASDGSVTGYSFLSTTSGKTIAQLQSMGVVGDDCTLLPAFDAAAKQWGDDWRVPKKSEYKNLMDLCIWTWTTNNNVVGYTVTGKGLYSGNSVFFPVTGYGSGTTTNVTATHIYMWSSTAEGNTSYRPGWTATSRGGASNTVRSNGYPIRPVKSMSAAKAASAVALDTRTGTRVVKTTESIAYDVAWGGASSGTLKVNGTAVSGLLSKGNYSWTPNTSQTNYWKLAYTAGTANYSATFKHLANYAITYADTKGATNTNPTQYNYDSSITFAALPNVTGYVFNGWNPTKIAAGGFGAKTVTAKWTPITYSVKFNKNGGTGTMADESFTYGTAKALTANAFTRTGYTFKGWATTSGATSAAYTDKQSVNNLTSTANGTVNLYAVWQVNTYTVKFNANGGSGTTAQLACTYGQGASLTANAFTRAGYAFVGWMTSANGTTVAYTDKQSVLNLSTQANATVNLYAKWTDKWYVDDSGDDANQGDSASQPFKTIQHAIGKSVEGMTIIVADGTYAPINSNNKSITIQSVNGAANTIIDGGYPAATNRCVYAGETTGKTNTVIRGFTIQNGCVVGFAGWKGAGVVGGTFYDCVVKSNHGGDYGGGAAYSAMYDCIISGNDSRGDGGGAYSAYLINCELANNSTASHGGGASRGVLINCTVVSNHAEKSGGGMHLPAGVTNCVIRDNVTLINGGGSNGGQLYECIVTNNIAYGAGGGVSEGYATKCSIVGNSAYQSGGGVHIATCYDSEILANKATQSGGGAQGGKLYNCVVANNECSLSSEGYGGGARGGDLENCLVYGNRSINGGGGGVSLAVCRNCTIYGNSCAKGGSGTHAWAVNNSPGGTNFNCIVYGNISTSQASEIDPRMVSFNCCTDDPHFIRAEAGDFRLRYNSPCINAGNNAYVTNTVDFAGNARIDNNTVDIGAYEYSASIDTNFTVHVENGTGGAIYYEGDTVTVAAEDRSPRYAFTRWTGDVSVLANANSMTNTFTMPTRNLSFAAEYDDLQSYLVIDLSGGPNAASYPVSNLTDIPSGGWTDEYKTTKLVLRRIDPGTFTMGSPTGEAGRADSDEAPHQVTLTHPYYIGVFELTQRQWELVMGNRPSGFSNTVCYATRPVENISYNDIRGADLGKCWPQMNTVDETSFMGKLRAKTGRLFDLPTEAQWEYACRAGTTTALNSGKNLSAAYGVDANMAEVGRYYYNSGRYDNSYDYNGSSDETGTAKVGSYLPNAWGLYDMHGNVVEACLDWYSAGYSNAVTDPVGSDTGTDRSERGGNWGNYSLHCRSGHKSPCGAPNQKGPSHGFRPVVNFANFSQNQVVNLSATDGTEPAGIRLTWTAVPGAENYAVWKSETSNFDDAVKVAWPTTTTHLDVVQDTNVHWYWVNAKVDGKYQKLSASDSGYRVQYQLTISGGTGTTNCFANTTVPIVANAAPTGYSFKEWTGAAADVALVTSKTSASTTFKMPGRAVTLTATYQPNVYTVKFNANKGAGTMENESFTYDAAKALTANAFTRTGYAYQGWATTAAGSKVYSDGETVSNLTAAANGTVNLYAVWTANPYTVTFNANGGTGDAMASQGFTYGTEQNLPNGSYTRTGYTFLGWSTNPQATSAIYADGASVSNLATGGTLALYAVWRPNAYTIRFLPNGAEGEMADQSATYDTAVNLKANAFTKEGYWFVGWCLDEVGAVSFTNRQEVLNLTANDDAVVTLVAKWADAWYVNSATGDDANEGFKAEQPLKTIQRAIDLAEDGQLIVVADGVYAPIVSNDKSITIRSVNGAAATVIDGGGTAICANLGAEDATGSMTNTVLRGFTLRNGHSAQDGGGVVGGTLYNCRIVSNEAERHGGGAAYAALVNCVVAGNKAFGGNGGGLYNSSAVNCTVVGNSATGNGGGTFADATGVENVNCIVSGNAATQEPNISSMVTKRSCFTGDPAFVDAANGDFRLKGSSPCIDMGNNRYVSGETDIRGNARIQNGIVDIGAYEFTLPTELGNVPVDGTEAAVPVEWLGAYGYVDEDSTPESLQPVMVEVGDNGIPLWESWVAGFDPLNPDSQLLADIRIVGDDVKVSWMPDLSNAEPKRHYTVMGKTNLTDTAWVIPVNEAHRFFKVKVTIGEPGRAKDVAATAGTSADEVTLSWSAADWAIEYNVYRATVDDFSRATLLATVDGTGFVDDTAVPGTLYYYWIVSVANGGEWMASEGATGYRKIGVPRGVAASDGTFVDWITVTWNAVDGAVSYRVLRATTDSLEDAVEVGTSSGTSWMDMGATSGVVYRYWVVAVGTGVSGEASRSDEGYLRLPAPENVTATNGGFVDRVDVAWEAVTAANYYRVFRSTSASGSKTPISEWQTELSYSDATAEPGVKYYYYVAAALDDQGLSMSGYSAGAEGSLKIGAPTGVYATDGTSATGVTVSWNATPGAEGYKVYRGTSNNPDAAEVVSSVPSVSFDDTTAEPGTLYFYWIVATNAVSESAKSAVETGFRSIPAPTGITATTMSGAAAVTVSWTPVEGALFYRVYRGTRTGGDYAVEIDTTTETTYADEGGAANRTYYYSVKAVGASCESDFSAFAAGSR